MNRSIPCYTLRDDPKAGPGGANRRVTNWQGRPPSFLRQLETCTCIEQLNLLRLLITSGLARDQLGAREFVPDDRTVAKWAKAQWDSAGRLLIEAKRCGDLCYIYNFMFNWPKPPYIELQLKVIFEMCAAELPNPTQELLRQGITIEGITKLP